MSEWKRYKLSELYEMSSGISSTKEQAGHGSPFLSFSVVFNNYFLPDSLIDLMDTTVSEKQKYSINEGDIFLTRTSETVDELAMSSVALKDYPEASFSGFLKRLRPVDKTIVYPKFIAFYLRSPLFRRTIINNTVMTLRASFNEAMFSYLEIMLPDFDTQKKIGDFLYSLEKKKQINNQINQELEAMAKTLYDYWFVQFDFPDQNGNPYKSSGGKMVYHPELKREIPEGWGVEKLDNLGTIVGGSTPTKSISDNFTKGGEGYSWITPNDLSNNKGNKFIKNGEIDVTVRGLKDASLKLYPEGTVLMSSRAPVGYLAIATKELTTNQGFKSFIPDKKYSKNYIYYTLQNNLKVIEQHASGSTFKEISATVLKDITVIQPNLDFVKKFEEKVSSINSYIKVNEEQNQELTQLRDWLLPMLMNGQVKVE